MGKKEDLANLIEEMRDNIFKIYNYTDILTDPESEEILSSKSWVEFVENLTKLKINLRASSDN